MDTPQPYDYQIPALTNLTKEREIGGNRSLVVLASGLGKTYVAAFDVANFIRETASPIRVLYLAHQTTILDQAIHTFTDVLGTGFSMGKYCGQHKEKDADLVFATFQSMSEHLEEFNRVEFDYVIADEAHHSAARTREDVLEYFRPRFLLGLTATPYRMDGQDIFRMYGDRVAYNLPLEMALANRLLPQIRYIVFTDRTNPEMLSRAFDGASRKGIFEARQDDEIVKIIHGESKKRFEKEKTVVFCSSLKQLHHYEKLFENCIVVTGEQGGDEQLQRINAFRNGDYSILLARDVLNEGINMPEVNMVVFLRNTASPVVFIQQLGRGLRNRIGKGDVVVLDFVGNIERIRFLFAFHSRLLTILRSSDHSAETLDRYSSFEFDQTARDVIKELLLRKCKTRAISPVRGLLNWYLAYELSPATITKLVEKGMLIPDYAFSLSSVERYFLEKSSIPVFLRRVSDDHSTSGLINENEFARLVGTTVMELRRREGLGTFCPTWIFKMINSKKVTFWYDQKDVELGKAIVW